MTKANLSSVLNTLGLGKNILQYLSECDLRSFMSVSKQLRKLAQEKIISLPTWNSKEEVKIVLTLYGQFFIFENGLLYAQGFNKSGHLGLKSKKWFMAPTLVDLPIDEKVIDVQSLEIGDYYSPDIISFILTRKGHVYACGARYSQLGLGPRDKDDFVYSPKKIIFPDGVIIVKMIITSYSSFFITATGQLFACGNNCSGHLSIEDSHEVYTPIHVNLPNHVKVADVVCVEKRANPETSSYRRSTFILTMDGDVYTCGYNVQFDLCQHDPEYEYIKKLTKISLPKDSKILSIVATDGSTNSDHNPCVYLLTYDNDIFVFGSNLYGQFGVGHANSVYFPIQIDFPNAQKIKKIKIDNFVAFFISNDDDVYACGANEDGRLGLGHNKNVLKPTKVPLPKGQKVSDIIHRNGRTFFLTTKGEVYFSGKDHDVHEYGRALAKKSDAPRKIGPNGFDYTEKYVVSLTKINFPKNTRIINVNTRYEGSYFVSNEGSIFVVGTKKFLSAFDIIPSRFSKYVNNLMNNTNPMKSPLGKVQTVLYRQFLDEVDIDQKKRWVIFVKRNKDKTNEIYLYKSEDPNHSTQPLVFAEPQQNNNSAPNQVPCPPANTNVSARVTSTKNQHLTEHHSTSDGEQPDSQRINSNNI